MATSGFEISGVLVHARADRRREVRERLATMPGVQVHACTPEGRLVVTIEDTGSGRLAATYTRIHDIGGVLGVALVYHHCEALADAADDPCPPSPGTDKAAGVSVPAASREDAR